MTAILGISAFYHDAAAAIVVDGRIVAAAQEERFTRKKHDADFPLHATRYCLDEARLTPAELDYVGFYEKPLLKFERILETYLSFAPSGFRSFQKAMPIWLKHKLHLPRELRRQLDHAFRKRFIFTEHHQSHAASAFFPSPFDEAAILTADGVGEWATATCGYGRGSSITLSHQQHFPHSPGLLYSAFTQYCGFRVNSDEYKLMGLAPYGEPRYADVIRQRLIDLKDDGSFRMDMSYFNYCHGLTMTSRKFARLFGGPPRRPGGPLTERDMDLAASIQVVIEEILLRMARHVHRRTGMKNLCLAGGVALNCAANGRVLREGPFEQLWIQPAAGDAGGALGVALFIWHQLLNMPREVTPVDSQHGSLLGPRFDEREIQSLLDQAGAAYQHFDDDGQLCREVARLIAQEKVVGWLQGRMEFGPRALGTRCILGDARSPRMQSLINLKIKGRESFRPFAPSVLGERAGEFFELQPGETSPYMLLVTRVQSQKLKVLDGAEPHCRRLEKLDVQRSVIPAVTHVDGSARVQTVDAQRNGRYYQLLKSFEQLTATPLILNTSFNVAGEPIVCSPADAYRCFLTTPMDALVLERFLLLKTPATAETSGSGGCPTSANVIARPAGARLCRKRGQTLSCTQKHRRNTSIGEGLTPFPTKPSLMQLRKRAVAAIDIPWNPTSRQLRTFGFGLAALLLLAGYLYSDAGWFGLPLVSFAAGLLVLIAATFSPGVLRPIFVALMIAAFPASWLISVVLLATIYYLVITPIGLLLRAIGRDPLRKQGQLEATSYWEPRQDPADLDGYFQQF